MVQVSDASVVTILLLTYFLLLLFPTFLVSLLLLASLLLLVTLLLMASLLLSISSFALFLLFLRSCYWHPLMFQLSLVPSDYIIFSAVNLPWIFCMVCLLLLMFPPVLASLLLLVFLAVPVVSCVAVRHAVDVFLPMLLLPWSPCNG